MIGISFRFTSMEWTHWELPEQMPWCTKPFIYSQPTTKLIKEEERRTRRREKPRGAVDWLIQGTGHSWRAERHKFFNRMLTHFDHSNAGKMKLFVTK